MPKTRIDRLLSNLGYGSRKDVTAAVKSGAFVAGGVTYKDASAQIDTNLLAEATFDGEPLDPPSPLTLLLNKPRGYTCSHDEAGLLIYDLLPPRFKLRTPALSSAGRLDKDSTGLVILTDDGQLLHKIISPKKHAEKHYHVSLRDPLRGDESALFATGEFCMSKDPKPLKPAKWIPDGANSGVMILSEGRYHQIRRMFATLDNHVETLHRFQIGGLTLGDLAEGAHLRLNDTETALITG
ncbi:MAG: 16S rRNA pseudouridine(516) synthase [Micavibrio aeruginosavorus]|uniref:Pseudouridine synthase n=1 Tax=Micavibrio aeruginosavorus TaxID=349221 RepID=A0A2W5BYD5_9BACT|nr:MAG: 16S rRNA pseudouridine(516) synthase [Micavibrio aeruginosavorus]